VVRMVVAAAPEQGRFDAPGVVVAAMALPGGSCRRAGLRVLVFIYGRRVRATADERDHEGDQRYRECPHGVQTSPMANGFRVSTNITTRGPDGRAPVGASPAATTPVEGVRHGRGLGSDCDRDGAFSEQQGSAGSPTHAPGTHRRYLRVPVDSPSACIAWCDFGVWTHRSRAGVHWDAP
jgi:hypothetical protein